MAWGMRMPILVKKGWLWSGFTKKKKNFTSWVDAKLVIKPERDNGKQGHHLSYALTQSGET